MTPDQLKRLDEMTERYRYCFYILGPLHSVSNELRLASFVSTRKPKEYQILRLSAEKTLVFWNPQDVGKHQNTMCIIDK